MTGLIVRIEGIEKAASVTFYTERDRCVRYEKKNLIRVLEEKGVSYYAMVDTRFIGRGNIMARVVFLDEEADGTRKVVAEGYTGFSVPCVCEGMGNTIKCGDYEVAFAKVDDIPVNYGTKVYVGALGEWVTGYKYITEEMVKNNLVEHSIGSAVRMDVRSGDRIVVAVPKDRKIGVFKDNGFGEKTAFDEKIMGANGLEMKIDGVDYKIYGEFFIVDGELNFYINMKNIIVDGPLVFSKANCPTREGEMVDNVNEIYDIPTPREGMLVYVRNEKKTYIITALKEKTINGVVVPQAAVESFELFAQGAQAENIETIEWNENCNIDLLLEAGEYRITGTRNATDDGLPILNTGHIEAVLMVMVAKEQEVAMQKLTLLNVNGGDANVYIRTLQNGTWDKWGKMQTNIEVNAVETLDNLTDNGIYSGVLGTETFVLVVINNYAVATQAESGLYISQLKYAVDLQGAVTVKTRRSDAYGVWNEWTELGGGGTEEGVKGVFPQQIARGELTPEKFKVNELAIYNSEYYQLLYVLMGNDKIYSLGLDFVERIDKTEIKEGETENGKDLGLNGDVLKRINETGFYSGFFTKGDSKICYTLRVENNSFQGIVGCQILQYVDASGKYVVKTRKKGHSYSPVKYQNGVIDDDWGEFKEYTHTQVLNWDGNSQADYLTDSGDFHLLGTRTKGSDGLPTSLTGEFYAKLTVICSGEYVKQKIAIMFAHVKVYEEYERTKKGDSWETWKPSRHPDLSTNRNILPYKFMGENVFEQMMPLDAYSEYWVTKTGVMWTDAYVLSAAICDKKALIQCNVKIQEDQCVAVVPIKDVVGQNPTISEDAMLRIVYTRMPEDNGYYY